MSPIARDPIKLALSSVFAALLALSLVKPPYPEFLVLQHVPTVAALVAIPLWDRRWPIGRGAFACLLGMLVLHVIGARYIYSFVPYDAWIRTTTGFGLSEAFGLERNHYDRLVHLCFGCLLVPPIREFLQERRGYFRSVAIVTSVLVVMTASAMYEVLEWLVAILFSPEGAEAYNGQQGDVWDAQKDMALALIGALAAGVFQWRSHASDSSPGSV